MNVAADVELVSKSQRLDMRAGDLVELLESDVHSRPSTSSSAAAAEDVQLLYGRNESTSRRGSFSASCVYVLPTAEKPTPDFVVSIRSLRPMPLLDWVRRNKS